MRLDVVWCGLACRGLVWCGVAWCGVTCRGLVRLCVLVRLGVVWCGLALRVGVCRGLVWCGVAWLCVSVCVVACRFCTEANLSGRDVFRQAARVDATS